ncbi:MAG: hypothetical protein ACM3SS_09210 [Rhodospirillaceae bacterium]
MQIPPSVLKRRLIQAAILLCAVVVLPEFASTYLPGAAPYVPPGVVSLLVLLSFGYAAVVWRTHHVLAWLFPGCNIELPLQCAREKTTANVSAWIGVAVSVAVLGRWLWGVL